MVMKLILLITIFISIGVFGSEEEKKNPNEDKYAALSNALKVWEKKNPNEEKYSALNNILQAWEKKNLNEDKCEALNNVLEALEKKNPNEDNHTTTLYNAFKVWEEAKYVHSPFRRSPRKSEFEIKEKEKVIINLSQTSKANNIEIVHSFFLNAFNAEENNIKIVNSLLNKFDAEEKKQLIKYLLKENENESTTALHYAAENGHENIVKLLLDSFFDTDEENEKLIQYLLKEDEEKRAALYIAVLNKNKTIVNLLLNAFSAADNEQLIQYLMKGSKLIAAHIALVKGHEEIKQLLLNFCAPLTEEENRKLIKFLIKENKNESSALHYFSKNGDKQMVQLLLNLEGNKDKKNEYLMRVNKKEKTALHLASLYDHEEIVILLLNAISEDKKEEFLMKTNKYKNSALHDSSLNGHVKIVKLLLDVFDDEEDKVKLNQYLLKENNNQSTAVYYSTLSANKKSAELIAQKLKNSNKLGDKTFDDEKEKLNVPTKIPSGGKTFVENQTLHDTQLKSRIIRLEPKNLYLSTPIVIHKNDQKTKLEFVKKVNKTLDDPSLKGKAKLKKLNEIPTKRYQSSTSISKE